MPVKISGSGAEKLQKEYVRIKTEEEEKRVKGPSTDYEFGYCDGLKKAMDVVDRTYDNIEAFQFMDDEERENRQMGVSSVSWSLGQELEKRKCPKK